MFAKGVADRGTMRPGASKQGAATVSGNFGTVYRVARRTGKRPDAHLGVRPSLKVTFRVGFRPTRS